MGSRAAFEGLENRLGDIGGPHMRGLASACDFEMKHMNPL